MLRKFFFAVLVFCLTGVSYAEETISLDYLIEKALEKSLSIEAELMQYKTQQSAKRQTAYSWLPTARLNLGKNWQDNTWQDLKGGFNASWGLYSNDGRYYDMRRQMIEMHNSRLSLEHTRKTIAYSVIVRYVDVLEAQEMLEMQQEILAVEEKKFSRLETRFQIGEISVLDLDQAEVDKIQAQISYNDLSLSLKNKRTELFYYVGCQDDAQKLIPLNLDITTEVKPYSANLQYLSMAKTLEIRKLQQKQALLDLLPVLTLNWNYSQQSYDSVTDFDNYNETAQISLSLSYSIFDVFINYENWTLSRRQYEYYKRQLEDQEKANIKELDNLSATLISQETNLQLYTRKAELAERVMQRAETEYEQGTISILDLNDYQNRLYSARKNQILEQYRLLQTQQQINLLLSDDILDKW
jgi:outer membrane protein TolC